MRCYYFGAWSKNKVGHYLYRPGGEACYRDEPGMPFRGSILDAGLLPPGRPQQEGRAYCSVINGWTVVTFWDRSADDRPGSNSAFVMDGEHPAEYVVAVARKHFPEVFGRPGFPLEGEDTT